MSLKTVRGHRARPHLPVVYSERADGYSPNALAVWFCTRFREIGIEGRFLALGAGDVHHDGGEEDHGSRPQPARYSGLAENASLAITQRHIAGDSAAKRNVIALI